MKDIPCDDGLRIVRRVLHVADLERHCVPGNRALCRGDRGPGVDVAPEPDRHLGVGEEHRGAVVGGIRRATAQTRVRRQVTDGDLVLDALALAQAELPADTPSAAPQDLVALLELDLQRPDEPLVHIALELGGQAPAELRQRPVEPAVLPIVLDVGEG